MIITRTVAFTIVILIISTNAYSNDPSATEILKEVANTYKAMKTYKAEGTITEESEINNNKGVVEILFSILLKKPNQYIITWTQMDTSPEMGHSVTVWSDGTQPFFYYRVYNAYYKMTNDETVLRRVKGLHGPFTIIPLLFLPVFKEHQIPFSWLKNPKVEKIEKIGEEDCYVISGSSEISSSENIWISKKSYLVRKYYRFRNSSDHTNVYLKYLKLNKSKLNFSDEQIEEKMENYKKTKTSSSFTEVYNKISSPELNKEDFNYTVPKGVVLGDGPNKFKGAGSNLD